MFCPKCRAEYIDGVTECADCRIPLVPERPPEPVAEYLELVTVFSTGNKAVIPLVKSILDDARITYFVKGESLQDTWPGFQGIGFNPFIGPAEFQVRKEDEKRALKLLKTIKE